MREHDHRDEDRDRHRAGDRRHRVEQRVDARRDRRRRGKARASSSPGLAAGARAARARHDVGARARAARRGRGTHGVHAAKRVAAGARIVVKAQQPRARRPHRCRRRRRAAVAAGVTRRATHRADASGVNADAVEHACDASVGRDDADARGMRILALAGVVARSDSRAPRQAGRPSRSPPVRKCQPSPRVAGTTARFFASAQPAASRAGRC